MPTSTRKPLQSVREAQRANKAKLDAEYQRLVQVGVLLCLADSCRFASR